MADITVTPANVVRGSTSSVSNGVAGAGTTIAAGQAVYEESPQVFKLTDANSATAAAHAVAGIALNGAGPGQPVQVLTEGDVNPGATLVVGTVYVASATPGGIAPAADLVSGWYTSVIGVATTASNLKVKILNSGVAVP